MRSARREIEISLLEGDYCGLYELVGECSGIKHAEHEMRALMLEHLEADRIELFVTDRWPPESYRRLSQEDACAALRDPSAWRIGYGGASAIVWFARKEND